MKKEIVSNPVLWSPSDDRIKSSQMYKFMEIINFKNLRWNYPDQNQRRSRKRRCPPRDIIASQLYQWVDYPNGNVGPSEANICLARRISQLYVYQNDLYNRKERRYFLTRRQLKSDLTKIHSFLKQCFFILWKQGPSADVSRG